ncbi:SDR family oxidoreductase [Flavobacterium rhizosphaerae]|uniref:SDR family oxidoreductase n=1 Tax=Flavobacterium rhizosphaerae TaxID=3163298 RepID=A0ABW8YRR2_9FLAO
MHVFVTGASGFVGSAIVNELISAGHTVLGLVRCESAAEKLKETGATVLRGDVNDPDTIKQGATSCDAVIHTAFNHDFSQYKASCEADRKVIDIFAKTLSGTHKPLIITSAIGILHYDRLVNEDDTITAGADVIPRAASEAAAAKAAEMGVNTYIVRLPPSVHGKGDHGFVPMIINSAKEHGQSAYINEGLNRWPAVCRFDAAVLYRLIAEQQPEQKVFHAVGEEGVPFIEIAKAISHNLQLPLVSLNNTEAENHFGWLTHFATMDCSSSSYKTRKTLNWQPKGPTLLQDMEAYYF